MLRRQQDCAIKKVKSTEYSGLKLHKYGNKLPKAVAEVLTINHGMENTLRRDAIEKKWRMWWWCSSSATIQIRRSGLQRRGLVVWYWTSNQPDKAGTMVLNDAKPLRWSVSLLAACYTAGGDVKVDAFVSLLLCALSAPSWWMSIISWE